MSVLSWFPPLLGLMLAPLLLGVINRVKALVAGRQGPPLTQLYFDLWKLFGKGAVYSRTTSWVFRAGPIVSLSAVLMALLLMPFANMPAVFAFPGDLIVFVSLLALGRFWTVSAALDTGSAFEGMGSAREVFFAALAEPALLLSLAAIAKAVVLEQSPDVAQIDEPMWLSLTRIHNAVTWDLWAQAGVALVFVWVSLSIVFLAENCRIPVDDPNTHLELTMIHEVMVLDHGGVDLGFILLGAAIKMWVLGALLVGVLIPVSGSFVLDLCLHLLAMFSLAACTGLVESVMARLRMPRVPQLLLGATTLAVLALVLEYRTL
jgi:formate hydrogenlyase subunit 4